MGCINHLAHEDQAPRLVTDPAALPHSVPPTSWSYTLYPAKLTCHREELQKLTDITDIYIWHPSSSQGKAHGDSRALHAPGAKWLNPVSQERRWCAERQVENNDLLLHSGPQLVLEDDQDFQLKHWHSQRSGTRAAEQVKGTVNLSRSLIRCERKTLCTQYSYWSYK